jgi:putative SOS response-associated peptidase YedK
MCNRYSLLSGQDAIREWTDALEDSTGNLPMMDDIFPDMPAPIVRNNGGKSELALARWGMPSPVFVLKDKKTDGGVTNLRNLASPHWKRWLGIENRYVVPFNAFSEYGTNAEGKKVPMWFALDESKPLAFFAGVWVPKWKSVRKVKEGEVEADLYGFLTTDANKEVAAIHPKAMPVILRTRNEVHYWLTLPTVEALKLQRSLPDGSLKLVERESRT